ncbi:MAG TPA: LapA family protein [Thermomicrobiales bacterium]
MTIETRPRWLVWHHRWTLRLVLFAATLALLTLFSAANYVLVDLRLLIWEGDVRLCWALLMAAGIGFVLGLLAPRLLR